MAQALLFYLHTATAALSLVPESYWNAETHRFNISSLSFANTLSVSLCRAADANNSAKTVEDEAVGRELYHYLRWALCAGAPGPGIAETMEILGRAESLRRLKEARQLTALGTVARS
jgi:glutamyl-tRNA synthetase